MKKVQDSFAIIFKMLSMGESLCRSLIRGFEKTEIGKCITREILLGYHPRNLSIDGFAKNREERLLFTMIKNAKLSDARLIGLQGSKLNATFERWERLREAGRNISKALSFRGFILSSVLGSVLAVISVIAPVILSFSLKGNVSVDTAPLRLFSLLMGITSSITIGLFFNQRRFYINPILTSLIYLAIYSPISSLVAFTNLSWLLNRG